LARDEPLSATLDGVLADNSGRGREICIAHLADRQHGNVTRRQLVEIGLSDDAIAYRVKLGRLHRVHAAVYGVGRPPKTALERAAAAVLACGPDAALSHVSALALWGFVKHWPTRFDVTIPGNRRPRGIAVHHTRTLQRRDLRTHQGIRLTSPARTLLDCAPTLTRRALARAVNEALLSKHLKRSHLAELLERSGSHRGTRLLTPFITHRGGPTRSEFEDAFLAFCERFRLPRPLVNTRVAGHEVDAFFEAEQLIVELDGYEFHSSREAFERDRDRDADAMVNGIGTVRITWLRLMDESEDEAARLHAILRAQRALAANPASARPAGAGG
jgi:very-short-patch-repair endonuclease